MTALHELSVTRQTLASCPTAPVHTRTCRTSRRRQSVRVSVSTYLSDSSIMMFGQHDGLECTPSHPRLGSGMTCHIHPTLSTRHTSHTPHPEAASVHGRAHNREPQRQLALSRHVLPPGLGVVLPRPHPVEEVGDRDGASRGLACGEAVSNGSVSDVAAVGTAA